MLARHLADRRAGRPCRVVGIMSGTSLDGVDLALVTLQGSGVECLKIVELTAFETIPLAETVKQSIQRLLQQQYGDVHPLQLVCELNAEWSRFVGRAIVAFLERAAAEVPSVEGFDTVLIGSHGQTLWHQAVRNCPPHSTLQLGDGEILSRETQFVVVSNFRNSDIAVGGCGAPLVPYLDRIFHSSIVKWAAALPAPAGGAGAINASGRRGSVALQNLGGIGNVTYFGDPGTAIAFDTGPANVILNELIEQAYHSTEWGPEGNAVFAHHCWALLPAPSTVATSAGSTLCDWNGCFSSRGSVVESWLQEWWAFGLHYFVAKPPKSCGRELFGASFVKQHCIPKLLAVSCGATDGVVFDGNDEGSVPLQVQCFFNLCRTAIAFTAKSLAHAYSTHLPSLPSVVCLSGGGAANATLTAEISHCLNSSSTKENVCVTLLSNVVAVNGGVGSCVLDDAKEAIAFAVLAHEKNE